MANKTEKTLEQLLEDLQQAQRAYEIAKQLDEKKKKEAEEKKKAELAAVKEKRYAEIEEARKTYYKLINDYVKDYGTYSVHSTDNNNEDDVFPFLFGSKPWRLFL